MYSACLFCAAKLGENAIVEHFPVGRRLAFDAAKGRLWVVCPRCERWNLTPLEERWEAIEDCERLYRATVVRTSTDNIGIAELRDGTRLIRIGKPLRPEFAAWRYGDQFGRRRRRMMWTVGGAAAAAAGVAAIAGGAVPSEWSVFAPPLFAAWVGVWTAGMTALSTRLKLPRDGAARGANTAEGRIILPGEHVIDNFEVRDDGHGNLRLGVDYHHVTELGLAKLHGTVVGREARWLALRLMPRVNGIGATQDDVREAVRRIDRAGGPEPFIPAMFAETRRLGLAYSPINELPVALRLALEMALHEDLERRAMEDELKELEAAWKEAEEIAALADNLFLGREVNQKFKLLKRRQR